MLSLFRHETGLKTKIGDSSNGRKVWQSSSPTKCSSNKLSLDGKMRTVVPKSAEDERFIKELVTSAVNDLAKIEMLKKKNEKLTAEMNVCQAEMEASQARNAQAQADRLANSRQAVVVGLVHTFKTNSEEIRIIFDQETLDKISFNGPGKCITTGVEGMEQVIIEYVKTHPNMTSLDLQHFKHDFKDHALVNLFQALPSTNVRTITIKKELDGEELAAKAKAESILRSPINIRN